MINTSPNSNDDRLLLFEDQPPDEVHKGHPWRILLVDDEQEVHAATLFALSDILILGRPLEFLHAYCAEEAGQILANNEDIAVIFLDVVMEQQDAGLKLIKVIREDLDLLKVRIILRTGQPGYAPELDAVRDYDINDYRTKSELTRTRLVTSLTSAIRSYQQICALDYSRMGLEKIIWATAELFEKRALESLAEGVLIQLAGLLGFSPNGVVCAQRGFPLDGSDNERFYVVGAAGCYAHAMNRTLEELCNDKIETAIRSALILQNNIYGDDYTVLYLNSNERQEAVFIDSEYALEPVDQQLVEVFAANISVGFANVYFFQQLKFLAYHDPVTRLPNRSGLTDTLDSLKITHTDTFVLILVGIDHFADINDVLGSTSGDLLVRAVADRLIANHPQSVQVGRYSGDTLCVIGQSTELDPEAIIPLFQEPFQVSNYLLPLSATLGVCASTASLDSAELLKFASLALTLAKRSRRGHYLVYSSQMTLDSERRMDLLQSLRQAIADCRLELHYQPFIDIATGTVIGGEALLRWRGEDGRWIPPSEFIPLAEQSGLILPIGRWIIEEACRRLVEWNNEGLGHLRVAINVSALQLRTADFKVHLTESMRSHGISGGQLELEVTESMIVEDIDAVVSQLNSLKQLGVEISVDDFGTGFSSLSYLQQLPIDTLKVDRSFIKNIESGSQGERIGEMIVGLAKVLQLKTVAEGIETEHQAQIAKQWGCKTAQGFLYSPALQADAFKEWVRQRLGQ